MDWIVLMAVGVSATAFMDMVAWVRFRYWGIPALDYALVGRWAGHMALGRMTHRPIFTSPMIKGEKALGWLLHYVIGAGLAVGLGVLVGPKAALEPSTQLHVGYGGASVLLPLVVMMPCLGFGFWARKTPNPSRARRRSLMAHVSFGVGLLLATLFVEYVRS